MRIYLALSTIISCFIIISAPAHGRVEVKLNQETYTFAINPRLSEVLSPIALKEKWYWPASKLYKQANTQSLSLYKQIIKQLSDEKQNNETYSGEYQLIIEQLEKWNFADRILIKIDYDLSRIVSKHNPQFDSGKYQIALSQRPSTTYVFGALSDEVKLPYQNNTCVEDVMDTLVTSAIAEQDFVYIISPEGQITKAPVAYWNKQCTLIIPGSMIYVPLSASLFSNASNQINANITQLAINRIFTQ